METPSTPAPEPPVWYLGAIELENVGPFGPRQRLELTTADGRHAQWTVLLGDNGAGKTTVLQAIAAVTAPVDMPDSYLLPVSRWVERAKRVRCESGAVALKLDVYRGRDLDEMLGRHLVEFDLEPRGFTRNRAPVDAPLMVGYGASRRGFPTSMTARELETPVASLFNPEANLIDLQEWFLRTEYVSLKEGPGGPASKRLEQVKQLAIELLPEVQDIHITGPGGRSAANPDIFEYPLLFDTPYGRVGFDQLSLGYQTMLTWVVDLAARLTERYPDSPNPLAEPVIVLVDEIDLHLQPKWQREITSFLSARFPRAQFIVTAHSPLIVQSAPDARIALVRRDGDHAVIDPAPDRVARWRIDQILTSELFGLDTALPRETERLLEERAELLSKAQPSPDELRRAEEIAAELDRSEPEREQRQAELLRRAAELVKKHNLDKP